MNSFFLSCSSCIPWLNSYSSFRFCFPDALVNRNLLFAASAPPRETSKVADRYTLLRFVVQLLLLWSVYSVYSVVPLFAFSVVTRGRNRPREYGT
jgi:hypothetical protein